MSTNTMEKLPLSISLSHSNNIAISVVHDQYTVGIDLEKVEERKPAFEKHWFFPKERLLIQNLMKTNSSYTRDFLQTCIWSIKESVCKALTIGGMGGSNLRCIEILQISTNTAKIKMHGLAESVYTKFGKPQLLIQHWMLTDKDISHYSQNSLEDRFIVTYVQIHTKKPITSPIIINSLVESA